MQYYILDEISPNINAPFLDLPDEIDLIETLKGNLPRYDELPITIEAEIDENVLFTDIINQGVPLFSLKMKNALEAYGISSVIFIPVDIVDSDENVTVASYWLGVVQDIVSCLDLAKSNIEENKIGAKVITTFGVDVQKASGYELFRFHHIPGLILINQDLKAYLEEETWVGVEFKPTQDYKRSL